MSEKKSPISIFKQEADELWRSAVRDANRKGGCPGNGRRNFSIRIHDYKSLRLVVVICGTPWLTQRHTHIDSFWPAILLVQPAELKMQRNLDTDRDSTEHSDLIAHLSFWRAVLSPTAGLSYLGP